MLGKTLRVVGITLMGLTAVFTILGGAGTTCVALDAAKYEMDAIAPYQWLYIFYVLAGIIIGVLGVRATMALIRSKPGAYRAAIIPLVAGLLIGGLHMATSRTLRGSSMPVDFVVYTTVLTTLLFLLFRIPGIWNQIDLSRRDDDATGLGAGVAMIIGGVVTLIVQLWAGPTHLINGINYADVWHTQLTIIGWSFVLLGLGLILSVILGIAWPKTIQPQSVRQIK
jgi:hypothetical protein